ncbi:transcription factor Adf-1-like [Ixodes scapularis]
MVDKRAFNEMLIDEVEKRPILWDLSDKEYKNNDKKKHVWNTIGTILGVEGPKATKRWKSLRDTYVKKKRDVNAPRSGAGADEVVVVCWAYFKRMTFLNDTLEYTQTSGNLPAMEDRSHTTGACELSPAQLLLQHMCDDTSADASILPESQEPMNVTEPPCPSASSSRPYPVSTIGMNGAPGAPRKKRRAEKPFDKEINLLGQLACKETDSAEHFGSVIAEKLRQCPKQQRSAMEIELLQTAAKYPPCE